jgi:hypothetical protein
VPISIAAKKRQSAECLGLLVTGFSPTRQEFDLGMKTVPYRYYSPTTAGMCLALFPSQ